MKVDSILSTEHGGMPNCPLFLTKLFYFWIIFIWIVYSMNDEATAHYVDIIDQMSLGLK